jgi:hypothetical protein
MAFEPFDAVPGDLGTTGPWPPMRSASAALAPMEGLIADVAINPAEPRRGEGH